MNNLMQTLDVKSGVLIVDEQPYYYLDLVQGIDGPMIIAYAFSKASLKAYKKHKDPTVLVKNKQAGILKRKEPRSTLGKYLADKQGTKSDKVIIKYQPALFTSPVLKGQDSITGYYGLGFPEMKQKSLEGPATGKYEKMEYTGVFIGLNNIKWLKDIYDFNRWKGYVGPLYTHYMPYFNTMF